VSDAELSAADAERSGGSRGLSGRPVAVSRSGEPIGLRQAVAILWRWTKEDAVRAVRHLYVNRIAGSHLVPRPLRVVLYRSAGISVGLADIFPGLTVVGRPANLRIGDGTGMNVNCFFECAGRVTVGNRVMMGMGVTVVTSDHPIGPDGRPQQAPVSRDVVIEDGVWLGARSTVLPGVTVGEGVVVSAGSVVSRNCLPYSLYAGVPARRLGPLPTTPGSLQV
jgi:acetyltransferase-like isoleucine patch superfamily enzyme